MPATMNPCLHGSHWLMTVIYKIKNSNLLSLAAMRITTGEIAKQLGARNKGWSFPKDQPLNLACQQANHQ
jgi:hypothetical protein